MGKKRIRQRRKKVTRTVIKLKLVMFMFIFLLWCTGLAAVAPRAETLNTAVLGDMESSTITNVLETLRKAKPGDVVYIRVQSPGGEYWTAGEILNAIRESKASRVVMEVDGYAASAAAMILLGADTVVADKADHIMYHTPYYEIAGQIIRTSRMTQEAAKWTREGFCLDKILTAAGWDAFLAGKDVVLDGDVFTKLNNKYNCGVKHGTNTSTPSIAN